MRRVVFTMLLLTIAIAFTQTGKTIRVAQNDVIVVDKLPITMVVHGDTLVLGDIGVRDADKNIHVMLQKKSDKLAHVCGDDKNIHIFTVTDTESGKGEKHKKIRVQIEGGDDDVMADADKKVMVWVDEMKEDSKILECKDGKNIRVHVVTGDEDDDGKEIILEEKMTDSSDTTKTKKREFVIIKKIDREGEAKEERKVIVAVDGKEITPVIGLGILLREKDGQVCVDKILEKVAPKDQPFKEGDQILKIEGKNVKSFKDFTKVYDAIENDKKVKVTVKRQNGNVDLLFAKPSEIGKMIYIQTKEK